MVALSLLPLTGMFIFGGKKEKKKEKSYEEVLKEAEERFGVPADTVKELAHIYVFNAGLPRLARHAHPEKDLDHVMKITGSVDRGDDIYPQSWTQSGTKKRWKLRIREQSSSSFFTHLLR
ncbi:hypothetical protein [Thermococcus sp.]|uniref:hypothetical protein n=1 Tax=Thermococcus sp. TaxID=35749 RepID=UPI002627E95F|nr:hypothetical protein [Thermococcus sp.]